MDLGFLKQIVPPGQPDRAPGPWPIDPGPPHMQPPGNPGGYKQYLAPKPDQGPHQIPPGTEDRHISPGPNDYNQYVQPQATWQQYGGNDVWGAYSMMLSQQANPQFADLIGQRAAAYGNALRMSGVQMLPFDQFQADVLHSLHLDELQQRYLQPRAGAGLGPGGVIG